MVKHDYHSINSVIFVASSSRAIPMMIVPDPRVKIARSSSDRDNRPFEETTKRFHSNRFGSVFSFRFRFFPSLL